MEGIKILKKQNVPELKNPDPPKSATLALWDFGNDALFISWKHALKNGRTTKGEEEMQKRAGEVVVLNVP